MQIFIRIRNKPNTWKLEKLSENISDDRSLFIENFSLNRIQNCKILHFHSMFDRIFLISCVTSISSWIDLLSFWMLSASKPLTGSMSFATCGQLLAVSWCLKGIGMTSFPQEVSSQQDVEQLCGIGGGTISWLIVGLGEVTGDLLTLDASTGGR